MEKDFINKIHTTKMGEERIKRNLRLKSVDVVEYCKNIILDKNSTFNQKGKNWYYQKDNIIITINRNSYTIITAKEYKNK